MSTHTTRTTHTTWPRTGNAASMLGWSSSTLRRSGPGIIDHYKTPGGHYRWDVLGYLKRHPRPVRAQPDYVLAPC